MSMSKEYERMMARIKERAERDREDERIRSELSRAQFESFCPSNALGPTDIESSSEP